MIKYLCLSLVACGPLLACSSSSNGSGGAGGTANSDAGLGGEQSAGGAGNGDSGAPDEAGGTDAGGSPSAAGSSAGGESNGGGGGASSADCASGDICFNLDGEPLSAFAGGYLLTHATEGEYAFVKYEMGLVQLSIEIYGLEAGTYDVLDIPTAGAARIAYYVQEGANQIIYQGRSGSVTVDDITDEVRITGAFEATLEKTVNEEYTGEELSVETGLFSDVYLPQL